MPTRLVTFLGIGHLNEPPYYKPCSYILDGVLSPPTTMHDAATLLAVPEITSLVVLGTPEVQAQWFGESSLYETLCAEIAPLPTASGLTLLPHGSTEAERWQLFQAIRDALWPDSLQGLALPGRAPADELGPPQQIILDITHGFRSLCFFAASALAFVRSQLLREERTVDLRILYSAFDNNRPQGEPTPVWDLTQFLDVLAWDGAITDLITHARGDGLRDLLKREQTRAARRPRAKGDPFPRFQALGNAAGHFADALVTTRTPELITRAAQTLHTTIDQARPDILASLPPLAPQLDHLQDWTRDLQATAVVSTEGLHAALHLAAIYHDTQRYAELAALLRETLVTAWTLVSLPATDLLQPAANAPGDPFKAQRTAVEHDLGHHAFALHTPGIPALFNQISNLRNDIQHAAFRNDPSRPPYARAKLKKALDDLTLLLSAPLPPYPAATTQPQPPTQTFLNLSNHPHNHWTDDQRQAALTLAPGPLLDLPFPHVPPDADEDHIQHLADDLLLQITQLQPAAVHLAGELTLTHALLQRLQRANIPTYAATTQREATTHTLPDGSTTKTTTFRFIRWRRYPNLI